jgi:hypothetical protein
MSNHHGLAVLALLGPGDELVAPGEPEQLIEIQMVAVVD